MGNLEESVDRAQSDSPEPQAQDSPFTAEVTSLGCPHCGSGKLFRIVGPGIGSLDGDSPDHYVGWNDGMIADEVERLNRLYAAIRQHVSATTVTSVTK